MASGKKNYFRHHFNARNDDKVQDLTDRFGPSGYFYFFVLVELQAEKCADDYQETCVYHQRTLIKELRLHKNKLKVFLEYSASISLISYTYTENRVEVCMPNLSKYMGRYSTKSEPNSSNKRKEKERKVKEIIVLKKPVYKIEKIYNEYPKKAGKKKGIEKLEKIIQCDKMYDLVLQGAKNYRAQCEDDNTPSQYIKQFSTWVNGEHWDDVVETESLAQKKLDDLETKLLEKWS